MPVEQLPFEYLINALRLVQGFDIAEFPRVTGQADRAILEPLRPWIDRKMIDWQGERLVPTARGQEMLNDILVSTLPGAASSATRFIHRAAEPGP